jgi:tetratricopeptide (TPR) repeat protein
MNVDGYASPEGEITFNQNLTEERANAAIDVVMGFLNDHDFDVNKEEFFSKTSQGEDWEGFKEMMMASTIKDKEMIIQYLKKYDDVVKREEKIRELSVAFEELREQILPELRRSKMTLHYAKTGLSNKELKDLAMSNPDSLELEEMLKAATLFSDHDDKLTVYKAAANQYPNDWRAHNNVGVIHMKKENMSKAIARFDKAIKVGDSPIPHNNRGVAARLKDNRDKALTHYEKAEGAGPEVGYNTGLVHIQNGNYKKAVLNMSELNTINTGLANLLNEDYKRAKQALNNADKSNAALAHYLRAIVGARTNNASMLTNNLEKAVRKNSSYSEKARNDLEFKEFLGTSEFESALGSS